MAPPKERVCGNFRVIKYDNGSMSIHITSEGMEEFKNLISRGNSTWQEASPHMRELCDIVTQGEILQNYHTAAYRQK